MIRCLNLGCGNDLRPSTERVKWVNLDRESRKGVDVAHDLETTPLPFPEESFDMVLASHVLEHLHNYLPLMRDLHRILKPGGTLVVKVPEFPCHAAVADPTHVRQFVPSSFYHFVEHPEFDTGGMAGLFYLVWLESKIHHRDVLDGNQPGRYFTEIHAELVKRVAHEQANSSDPRR